MITATVRHRTHDPLQQLTDTLFQGLSNLRQNGSHQRFRRAHGFVGLIRSTEVVWGSNGWHPHVHELWIFDPTTATTKWSDANVSKYVSKTLGGQWRAAVQKASADLHTPSAECGIKVITVDSATDYLFDQTFCQTKQARTNRELNAGQATKSLSFWDILAIAAAANDAGDGDAERISRVDLDRTRARQLVVEYAQATWRRRQSHITCSRTTKSGGVTLGLRDRFCLPEALTDEEILVAEECEPNCDARTIEPLDPVTLSLEFATRDIKSRGFPYLAALVAAAAETGSVLKTAENDGWLLLPLGPSPEGYQRYRAVPPPEVGLQSGKSRALSRRDKLDVFTRKDRTAQLCTPNSTRSYSAVLHSKTCG